MKITKTKEVVTEDIEVKAGTYYFEDDDIISHKFTLAEPEEDYTEYIIETLRSSYNNYGIRIVEDGAWYSDQLPYTFKQFILGIAGKEITKEDFDKEKQEVLDKLNR
jgi:hypothetical protein